MTTAEVSQNRAMFVCSFARVALVRDPISLIEEDFRRAIAIAGAQGAQRFGLRAATSLARLGGMPDEERRQLLIRPMQAINQGMALDDARTAREILRRVEERVEE